MELTSIYYGLVWALLLAVGWRRRLLAHYPLFYVYVLASIMVRIIGLMVISQSGIESQAYLNVYLASSIVLHTFEIGLALQIYRLFAPRPRYRGFLIALVVIGVLEFALAPSYFFVSHILHILFVFEAVCCLRAAFAAFLGEVDPGGNWKAILIGLFLSSNVLVLNHAGKMADPINWPYHIFATVVLVSQMAMWLIFLLGMRRYSPPRPFTSLINHPESFSRRSK